MANYDAYKLTYNPSTSTGTLTNNQVEAVNAKPITDNGTDNNTLGSIANDTFIVGAASYQYIGNTLYTNQHGSGQEAFVAEKLASGVLSGTYFLFTPTSAPVSGTIGSEPSGNQTVTTTMDNTSTPSTQWSLTSNTAGCFVAGTRIATPGGDAAVESLAAGDLVLTADGREMPVRWLGRSVVSRVFADPARILPVRIKAGALAENIPARDLLVSPGHAIRVGGVLAHAGALVNGASIVREQDMPLVFSYYHLELDTHTLLLAEGAPAESFLEGVEDMGFANWDERTAPGGEEMPYPRAKSPRQLPRTLRDALTARAVALFGPVSDAA